MHFRAFLFLAGALVVLAFSRPAKADQGGGEDLFKARGLQKLNQYLVLPDEAVLAKKVHEIDALRKKVINAQQVAAAAERAVDDKKKLILDYAEKRRALRVQLDSKQSVETHNRLVNLANELGDRMIILEKSDKEEKEVAAAATAAATVSEQYIELLLKLRQTHDQILAKYAELAADAKLQEAVADLNRDSSKPLKLGPTPSLSQLERNLRKLEAGVLSESIPLRRGAGNLWHVTVTFNGKHAQDIAIDTGASLISLPYKVAQEAGITPSPQDRTLRVSLADGRTVEAKQVFAPSVRLGKFTVEHIECVVMPADMPNAEPLLGLSFLKHFVVKIDNAGGKLTMSRIDQPERAPPRPASRSAPREKAGEQHKKG